MALKILIDMIKLREAVVADPDLMLPDAYSGTLNGSSGLKSLRELALFLYTCRRCEDAPCINICPAGALEKNGNGMVERHTNLCVSCKSCIMICPFGTMMTDIFAYHRNRELLYDIRNEEEMIAFMEACPCGTVSITEKDEEPERNIYRFNEHVLIRDYMYIKNNH